MPVQVRPAVPEAASGDNRPFWAIFLCKENSPQKGAMPRLYSLPGELSSLRALQPFIPVCFRIQQECEPRAGTAQRSNERYGEYLRSEREGGQSSDYRPDQGGSDDDHDNRDNHDEYDPDFFHDTSFQEVSSLVTKGYLRPLTSRGESLLV